jgi:hypothetical protein
VGCEGVRLGQELCDTLIAARDRYEKLLHRRPPSLVIEMVTSRNKRGAAGGRAPGPRKRRHSPRYEKGSVRGD